MLKRGFDLLAALLGLIFLAPLFLLIALAIKLESPGPVFFRQQRVGRNGQLFRIFKFRTMRVGGAGPQLTVAGDKRITRVGAWLRSSKLDELAQLIDVLRGTMSLVGPRPEVPQYIAHYPPEWRERLLSVRPGITDFASVRYRDESALLARASDPEREYLEVILPTKLRYAMHTVERPSLSKDLHVIGLTLLTVFSPRREKGSKLMSNRNPRHWLWLHRQMSTLTPGKRLLAGLADGSMVLLCWHLTYLFRLGFERWQPGRPWYDDLVSIGVVLCYLLALALAGVPRGLWRFFEFDDLRRIAFACLSAGLLSAIAVQAAGLVGVARAVLVLHPLFCILALSLSRMGARMLWEHASQASDEQLVEPKRAIILGAGAAARRLLAVLDRRDGWTVLALLDDDPAKQGLRIAGVTVQGSIPDLLLPHLLAGVTHVIVAMPQAAPDVRERVIKLAQHTGLTVLSVPPATEHPAGLDVHESRRAGATPSIQADQA